MYQSTGQAAGPFIQGVLMCSCSRTDTTANFNSINSQSNSSSTLNPLLFSGLCISRWKSRWFLGGVYVSFWPFSTVFGPFLTILGRWCCFVIIWCIFVCFFFGHVCVILNNFYGHFGIVLRCVINTHFAMRKLYAKSAKSAELCNVCKSRPFLGLRHFLRSQSGQLNVFYESLQ